MSIEKAVKLYLRSNPWPEKDNIVIGPTPCGTNGCQEFHAWARAVRTQTDMKYNKAGIIIFIYHRPCNPNERENPQIFYTGSACG